MQKCFEVFELVHMGHIVKIILENVTLILWSIVNYHYMLMDAELSKSILKNCTLKELVGSKKLPIIWYRNKKKGFRPNL